MRECMYKVQELINAKTKCIWINSYEEQAVINDIKELSLRLKNNMPIYSYSFSLGIEKVLLSGLKNTIYPMPIDQMLRRIYNISKDIMPTQEEIEEAEDDGELVIESKNNIFILKDYHLLIDNANIKRAFRDVIELKSINYNTIIIISPIVNIPIELEKAITIIDYDTPNDEMILNILTAADNAAAKIKGYIEIEEQQYKDLCNACKGLTVEEINHIVKLSIVKNRSITVKEINDYKIELIKKSNILEYKIPHITLDDVGGNYSFKKWVNEVVQSMSAEAQEFGCDKPKGYISLGIPGTAKTLLAEALASSMQVPFLKLDMSRILDSKVGSSEQNIAQAIKMVKSTAPCLLLIDEVEKTLSGLQSSGSSDSGTMARMIGSILEFLNEDHGVFVVMTSNDISQLPPELTRAGRVDAIWYFSLPEDNEREEIFRIHLSKKNKELDEKLMKFAVDNSQGFTGAEIKEAVKIMIRKAYCRYLEDGNNSITEDDIIMACSEIIPISKSSREKIASLEEYAKNRARFSNRIRNQYGCNINKNADIINNILTVKDLKA